MTEIKNSTESLKEKFKVISQKAEQKTQKERRWKIIKLEDKHKKLKGQPNKSHSQKE